MATKNEKGATCSNCGAANQPGSPYCRHCKVPGAVGKQKASKKSSAKKKTARR